MTIFWNGLLIRQTVQLLSSDGGYWFYTVVFPYDSEPTSWACNHCVGYLWGGQHTLSKILNRCYLTCGMLFQVLDPEFRKPYQNVNRWFTTLINQPEFKEVIGEFKMAEKMAQFDGVFISRMLSVLYYSSWCERGAISLINELCRLVMYCTQEVD